MIKKDGDEPNNNLSHYVPPWHMNPGMTRWKDDPANPNPFSPRIGLDRESISEYERGASIVVENESERREERNEMDK